MPKKSKGKNSCRGMKGSKKGGKNSCKGKGGCGGKRGAKKGGKR